MTQKIEWGSGTPGPWQYETGPSLNGRYHTVEQTAGASETMICECYEGSEAQQEANARAIAEVPAMVQALRSLAPMLRHALPKFNWGASALDADAYAALNGLPSPQELDAILTRIDTPTP